MLYLGLGISQSVTLLYLELKAADLIEKRQYR